MLKLYPRLVLVSAVLMSVLVSPWARAIDAPKSEKESAATAIGKESVNDALIACLADAKQSDQLKIKKQKVYEQDFSVAGLECKGPKAKALYEAIKSKPIAPYKDREVFVRYLGRSTVPSLCTLAVADNKNSYHCFVRLDLSKDITDEIR